MLSMQVVLPMGVEAESAGNLSDSAKRRGSIQEQRQCQCEALFNLPVRFLSFRIPMSLCMWQRHSLLNRGILTGGYECLGLRVGHWPEAGTARQEGLQTGNAFETRAC